MLSLIVTSFEPALPEAKRREGVARSLASLVPCVVQGVIADAALIGPLGAGLERVADEAGCAMIEAADGAEALVAALRETRCPDVLLLSAGYAAPAGFAEAARDLLAFGGLAQARVLRLEPNSLATRLAPSLARAVGVLARKDALAEARSGLPAPLARTLRAAEIAVMARACV